MMEMTTKTKNLPALRFPGFVDDWVDCILGDVTHWTSGGTPSKDNPRYWDGDIPWVSASSMRGNEYFDSPIKISIEGLKNGSRLAPCNSLLILVRGSMLFNKIPIGVAKRDLAFNQDVKCIVPKTGVDVLYLLNWFSSKEQVVLNMVTGTGIGAGKLDIADLKELGFILPTLPEQQKIASFLTAIDSKINQLTRKKQLLEQYKKGVMQKIFNQELRFKDEKGGEFPEWEFKQLNTVLYESKKRNFDNKFGKDSVLSVSGEYGIVNQIELLGRSYAGESVSNYHVVENGDVVYTKSPLKSNPYGIIKVNKGKAGIVSTLYAVYKCKKDVSGTYLDFYFSIDTNVNNYLRPLVHKGAKNDMKINNAHVLDNEVPIPSMQEQLVIISFFESLDTKITQTTQQLERTQTYKKGLLQQMFV